MRAAPSTLIHWHANRRQGISLESSITERLHRVLMNNHGENYRTRKQPRKRRSMLETLVSRDQTSRSIPKLSIPPRGGSKSVKRMAGVSNAVLLDNASTLIATFEHRAIAVRVVLGGEEGPKRKSPNQNVAAKIKGAANGQPFGFSRCGPSMQHSHFLHPYCSCSAPRLFHAAA